MGRPHKGTRMRATVRLPAILHADAVTDARRRGLTLNDWLVWAVRTALTQQR